MSKRFYTFKCKRNVLGNDCGAELIIDIEKEDGLVSLNRWLRMHSTEGSYKVLDDKELAQCALCNEAGIHFHELTFGKNEVNICLSCVAKVKSDA